MSNLSKAISYARMVDAVYDTCNAVVQNGYENNITYVGVNAVVDMWLENKENLFNFFGGELKVEKTIKTTTTRKDYAGLVREYSYAFYNGSVKYKNAWMQASFMSYLNLREDFGVTPAKNVAYVLEKVMNYCADRDDMFNELRENKIGGAIAEVISHFTVDCYYNSFKSLKNINGKKFSKFMRSFLIEGMEKLHYDNVLTSEQLDLAKKQIEMTSQYYSTLLEKIKVVTKEKKVVLSIDPNDFFRCSHGENWESCHALGNMHGDGAVQYCVSPCAMIAYIESEKDADNYCGVKPLEWRQMVYTNKNLDTFVGSRQYRTTNKDASRAVMEIIKELGAGLNYEFVEKTSADVEGNFQSYVRPFVAYAEENGEFAYNDIHRFSGISNDLFLMYTSEENSKVEVNSCRYIPCLDCGEKFSEHRDDCFCCNDCQPAGVYCEHCGDMEDEDDIYYVNDYPVCRWCLENSGNYAYCDDCEEWFEVDEITTVTDSHGWDRCVCDRCLEDYVYCEECGEYHAEDNMNSVMDDYQDTKYICNDCMENCDEVCTCPHCGDIFYNTGRYDTETCCFDCHLEIEAEYEDDECEDEE